MFADRCDCCAQLALNDQGLGRTALDACLRYCITPSTSSDISERATDVRLLIFPNQDLRNHGTAPHQQPHTYLAFVRPSLFSSFASFSSLVLYAIKHFTLYCHCSMASDISAFFSEHNLGQDSSSVHLMGHSMGGKAVMATALHPELHKPLKSLISVDMSPAIGKISPE